MTTLITGATGKTGRRILSRLSARGVPVRAASRPSFDWSDPSGWIAAVDGVDAVYIAYAPDLAVPGAPAAVARLTELAVAAGARRVVLLSGRGEAEAQAAERAVQAAAGDAAWTVVRCSWFMQNFSESVFLEPVQAGELALPVSDVREPFVDLDDVADVAVAALTEDGHAGRVYECTGPELLTFADAVAAINAAAGRDVRFVTVPLEAWTAELTAAGVPEGEVGLLQFLFGEVLDGRNAYTTDGIREALGRAPRTFAAFAHDSAAAFRLNGSAATEAREGDRRGVVG